MAMDDVIDVMDMGDVLVWGPAEAGISVRGRDGTPAVWTTARNGDAIIEPLWAICSGEGNTTCTITVRTLSFAGPHLARVLGPRLRACMSECRGASTAVLLVVQTYMRIGLVQPCKPTKAFAQTDLLLHGDLDASLVPGVQLGPDVYVCA